MLRAEGRAEGLADALVRQLEHRFGPLSRTALDTIHVAPADQLQTWSLRVLDATSLDDVLR
ncbi:DUF4351 domain-containing protein [Microlunatus parietis]|uniref:DUF4351 domain-containing protein n=1 Tax=Microlunatus parietis TaxID=682979 RepID=UPI0015CBB650